MGYCAKVKLTIDHCRGTLCNIVYSTERSPDQCIRLRIKSQSQWLSKSQFSVCIVPACRPGFTAAQVGRKVLSYRAN